MPSTVQAIPSVASGPLARLRAGGRFRLAELAPELAFFTTAALHTYGRLDADPVAEYLELNPGVDGVGVHDFDRPVLDGLPQADAGGVPWRHRLFFCPREVWPGLLAHLAGVAISDRVRRVYAKAEPQVCTLSDPELPLSRVHATCFGLDSSRGLIRWEDRHGPACTVRPAVVVEAPRPETVALAKALFARGPAALAPGGAA